MLGIFLLQNWMEECNTYIFVRSKKKKSFKSTSCDFYYYCIIIMDIDRKLRDIISYREKSMKLSMQKILYR